MELFLTSAPSDPDDRRQRRSPERFRELFSCANIRTAVQILCSKTLTRARYDYVRNAMALAQVDLPNLLPSNLRLSIMTSCFDPKGRTMPEVSTHHRWSHNFNELDRDVQLKQALDSLEMENTRLKRLVVRLSETIIRNVSAKR